MTLTASAPGKLFVLGEYAVLDGSPALVAAVSARARARITPRASGWSVTARQHEVRRTVLVPGKPSDFPLLDVVLAAFQVTSGTLAPCAIELDTQAFFSGINGHKRGLGSSAALITALYAAVADALGEAPPADMLGRLRELHDAFQGRPGSGGDLAASLHGGLIRYRLEASGSAQAGSVTLPDSVGFACVCTGQSASSPAFVRGYRDWQKAQPARAAEHRAALERVAQAGCDALVAGEAAAFLAAVADYGELLAELGRASGAPIVTPEHEQLNQLAERYGVAYKVSGAGGGDMGVAFAQDTERLAAFVTACRDRGFECPDLDIDPVGVTIEHSHD